MTDCINKFSSQDAETGCITMGESGREKTPWRNYYLYNYLQAPHALIRDLRSTFMICFWFMYSL